ncbi:S-adenosyl-L-methionine-dependent methyltransferase [Tothia fuscella]|uniref:S-adenosyl-L-methionine-dependent methyltransferase n=1 Tax=Tothia fuscella TaxID=1048955 RepID=A0A9P4TT24_9PEZI|nr:S-adenosyl-L-methionine-dependent methyltransferase [Tothia fuscella]
METLVAPLNGHNTNLTDEGSRLKLQDTLRTAAESTETPHDTMLRLFNAPLQVAVVKAGIDLGLFNILTQSKTPVAVEQIAQDKGADPLFIGRLLRYLASIRLVEETSKDHFAANKSTIAMSDSRVQGAMNYTFNISGPAYQAFPKFCQDHNYQNRTGGKFPWHAGAQTDLDFFPWAKQNPEGLQWFQQLMSVPREGDWLDVVPMADVTEQVLAADPERTVFVDVGGSVGHQCARLTTKLPQLKGHVVLQDLKETIDNVPAIDGVQAMAHDFFTPEPVKGARCYYLCTVLHDWDDEKAIEILKNLIPALGPDSQILIDDMALPNTGVHWWSACLDLHMYTMLGAMERNEDQWHALLDKAGLKALSIETYSPTMRHSIITAVPK